MLPSMGFPVVGEDHLIAPILGALVAAVAVVSSVFHVFFFELLGSIKIQTLKTSLASINPHIVNSGPLFDIQFALHFS